MPTENRSSNNEQVVSVPFRREDRYIVIKRSDLERLPAAQRHNFSRSCRIVHEQMFAAGAPSRSFLTIESDWPEYEPVWSMIETRVTGQPTSDGFSAGDMADQGAKAFRDGQQAAIPEGFALVPKEMLLSKEVIGVINFHCGDSAEEEGGQFGKYTDGRLWVGNVTDDDGSQVHGLHIMTDEYPEEGSTTLVEFPPPSSILPE
ncbi:hypothetical protein [Pseudomonas arcuscaelestis]|uniref:hypothetical protein n=1 Tax=Pseudomonas arcuscaelestis TaxID=2710591 RepID=UPI001F4091EF|nr:hypothetical protein [Pseudomonas arcuscaelestis]